MKEQISNILLKISVLVFFVYLTYYLHTKNIDNVDKQIQKIESRIHAADSSRHITDSLYLTNLKLYDTISINNTYIKNYVNDVQLNKPKFDTSLANAVSYLIEFSNEKIH